MAGDNSRTGRGANSGLCVTSTPWHLGHFKDHKTGGGGAPTVSALTAITAPMFSYRDEGQRGHLLGIIPPESYSNQTTLEA